MFVLWQLLQVNVKRRVCTFDDVRNFELIRNVNWDSVLAKEIKPVFTPPVRLSFCKFICGAIWKSWLAQSAEHEYINILSI